MFYLDCGLKPPSVNHSYGRRGTRTFITPLARQFKKNLGLLAKSVWKKPPLTGRLSVDIIICYGDKRIHDLDNTYKITLDSLKGIVIADDSLFDRDQKRRLLGDEPRLIIRIEPLPDNFQEELQKEVKKGE